MRRRRLLQTSIDQNSTAAALVAAAVRIEAFG
jgi:hypothetical protein